MELDFLDRLKDKINSFGLYAHCTIGLLDEGESLSIMAMPGGEETVYYDGERDKDYQIQVNAKSIDQNNCFDALTKIYQILENLEDLPSQNGSYDFQKIETRSLPNLVTQDEQGFFVWALNISASITIYQGVNENG